MITRADCRVKLAKAAKLMCILNLTAVLLPRLHFRSDFICMILTMATVKCSDNPGNLQALLSNKSYIN